MKNDELVSVAQILLLISVLAFLAACQTTHTAEIDIPDESISDLGVVNDFFVESFLNCSVTVGNYGCGFAFCETLVGDDALYCKADSLKDEKFCKMLKDDSKKEECIFNTENDLEKCHILVDSYRQGKRQIIEDTSVCEAMALEDDKFLCLADLLDDLCFCKEIKNKRMRDNCLLKKKESLENSLKDERYCNNSFCSDLSFRNLAIQSKNISFCREISNVFLAERCEREFDFIFYDLGTNNFNESFCLKVKDDDMRNACLAITNNNIDKCREVKKDRYKLSCFTQLGEKLGLEFNICDELRGGDLFEQCIEYFEGLR